MSPAQHTRWHPSGHYGTSTPLHPVARCPEPPANPPSLHISPKGLQEGQPGSSCCPRCIHAHRASSRLLLYCRWSDIWAALLPACFSLQRSMQAMATPIKLRSDRDAPLTGAASQV